MRTRSAGLILLCAALHGHLLAADYCVPCPRDAQGRIQRSAGAKTDFKRQNPCPATLQPRGPCPGYVIDHIVALKRGGLDAPSNMQWQTRADAKAKDRWE